MKKSLKFGISLYFYCYFDFFQQPLSYLYQNENATTMFTNLPVSVCLYENIFIILKGKCRNRVNN